MAAELLPAGQHPTGAPCCSSHQCHPTSLPLPLPNQTNTEHPMQLVVMVHLSNVLGSVLPAARVCQLAHEVRPASAAADAQCSCMLGS